MTGRASCAGRTLALPDRPDEFGYGPWDVTATGTNAGVTATHTITSGAHTCYVTSVECSGDAAAVVTVESPSGTVLIQERFAAAFTFNKDFDVPLVGAAGQNVLVKISASTAHCEANMQGYDV